MLIFSYLLPLQIDTDRNMSAKFPKGLVQDFSQFAGYILSDDSTGCKEKEEDLAT